MSGLARVWTPWRGAAGAAAIGVLAVQLVWRTAYLAHGYFTQDDFLMLHLGGTSPMSLSYLWQPYAGHLFPGGFVIAYVEAHLAPLSWPAAYIPVVLMQLGAGVLMWLVLTRLLGARWERVPLLAVFCLSPLSLWSTQWWAVAIQFLPVELCGLAAAYSYLRLRQDAAPWARELTVAFTALGLMFQERALLIPLLVLAVAVVVEPGPRVAGRGSVVLRAGGWLWPALAAVVVVYLAVHVDLAPAHGTSAGGAQRSLTLVANYLFRNVVPGLAGGPWAGVDLPGAAVVPATWVVVVSCVLVGALVLYTVRFGGATARAAWLALLAYLLVDVALVFGGRAGYGPISGLTARYAADAVPVLVVALAGALRDAVAPAALVALLAKRSRPRRRPGICCAVALTYLASAAVTTTALAPDFADTASKEYVDNLHADLAADPGVVLYDSGVPDDVMFGWFLDDARVSTVIGIAPWAPPFDVPSEQMRIVDDAGHVHPIALQSPVQAFRGPIHHCGYGITLNPTLVYLRGEVPFAKNVVELGYYTNVDDDAVVTAGGDTVEVPVSPGLHEVDIVVSSAFNTLSVRLARTSGVLCLASVAAGVPVPAAP